MLSPVRIHKTKEAFQSETLESSQGLGADRQNVCLRRNSDEIDRPHKNAMVRRWDVVCLIFSIVTHIFDIGADIYLASKYFVDGKITYFAWTVAFILFPAFVNTFISFRIVDQDLLLNGKRRRMAMKTATTTVTCTVAHRILVFLFQLAPLLRYCNSLRYALKALRYKSNGLEAEQQHYYLKMLKEDEDVALLRVFECFLEAAPQQILQLNILLRDEKSSFQLVQMVSVCSSLVSMGWSMASYHRMIRLAQRDKENIGVIGTILQFLWHFCIIMSRILSISVVASMWPMYTGLACILHCAVMTTWLNMEPNGVAEFCRDGDHSRLAPLTRCERVRSFFFSVVLGFVYIFTYLNPSEGRTFVRHLFYYALCIMENVGASILWAMEAKQNLRNRWYFELITVLCCIPFVIGIVAMTLYYVFFHPTSKRRSRLAPAAEPS
ncbi:XK-related protein 6-like [Athalia rosae]|uniref:XK-related protein 6-like n=1 Tax=Athalia rosae TaxID=37344 RepID=UPI0020338A7E|nr:XK-related protein 6-like [Athalia rosae]